MTETTQDEQSATSIRRRRFIIIEGRGLTPAGSRHGQQQKGA